MPVRLRLGDRDGVEVVQAEFHGEEAEGEAQGVGGDARPGEGGEGVSGLGDVVVEVYDGADEVEGGVEGVGEVVCVGEG